MINAILLNPILNFYSDKNYIDYKAEETCNLARAINIAVIHKETFALKKADPGNLIRKGKIEQIKNILEILSGNKKIEIMIFCIDLSPIQQRNLEKIYNLKVLDKTSLILEIFGERAVSKEGSLQVELAHLNWHRSRLVRSWTHLERQRGGYGFLGGPGESQIELDKRMIDKRIKQLKKMIIKIKKTRNMQYSNRTKNKVPVVSLLGYTNAGKSTLFNKLTKLDVSAKNKLFETLDTKTSHFYLPLIKKAYISDTVGFISDLPTMLVESFKSTLEEINKADLLIHVRDICSQNTESHKKDVLKVLEQLNINPNTSEGPPMIEVMNKIDIASNSYKENVKNIEDIIFISARTGHGIENLKLKIDNILNNNKR